MTIATTLKHFQGIALCTFLCIALSYAIVAQNLIPNPGVEEYVGCPYSPCQALIDTLLCHPWISWAGNYFNACSEWPCDVPDNFRGSQEAHEGGAYLGGYVFDIQGSSSREWFSVQLLEPMIAGNCYEVSFWVNRADSSHCGIKHTGAFFTQEYTGGWILLGLTPQIQWSGGFLMDQDDWMQIHGYFVAEGGEEWMTLGNFMAQDECEMDPDCPDEEHAAYYYYDDVLVQEVSPGGPFSIDLGGPHQVCNQIILSTGVSEDATFTWSNGSHESTLVVTESGTYSVTVSLQCIEAEATTEVTILGSPPVSLGTDVEMCGGESYTITLDPELGEYFWSDGSSGPTITISETGTYSVTLDDGCDLTAGQILVNVIQPPPASILGNDTTLCEGEVLVFTISDPDGWVQWQDGSNNTTYIINETGAYAVTLTNPCGTSSDMILVDFAAPPEFDLGQDSIILCAGEAVTLSVDDSLGEVIWQDGSSGPLFEITTPGLYGVTITNLCGQHSDLVQVDELAVPEFELGDALFICPGETLFFDGPDLSGEYLWQNGSTDNVLEISGPGVYALTVTNQCGSFSDELIVELIPGIEVPDLGPDLSICSGDAIILSVGQINDELVWNDQSTGSTLTVTAPGTYFVTVFTQCGPLSDTVHIATGTDGPDLDLPETMILCTGQSITIGSGVQNVSYVWNDGSMLPELEVDEPGMYFLTVTNACGSDVDSIEIIDGGPAPYVSLGADTSICLGESISIEPVSSEVEQWLWSDGSDTSVLIATGAGVISVEVSNVCGLAYDTIVVELLPEIPLLDLGPDTTICPGESVILSIPHTGFDILWSDNSNGTELQISNGGIVYATISNHCGLSSDTMYVEQLPETPLLDLGVDQTICPGETIVLAPAITDVTYAWQDGSTADTFQTSGPGIFHLTITNSCGAVSDTIVITESTEGPQLDLGPDIYGCEGESVTISAGISGVGYLWQDGSTAPEYMTNVSGTYILIVENNCGLAIDTIDVVLDGMPPVTALGTDTSLCAGASLTLSTSPDTGTTVIWQDGSSGNELIVIESGIYTLTQVNMCGSSSDSIEVHFNMTVPMADLGGDTAFCEGSTLLLIVDTEPETEVMWQDGSTLPELTVSDEGVYSITLTNQCGSDSDTILIDMLAYPASFDLGPDIDLCPGDTVLLFAPMVGDEMQWQDGSTDPVMIVDQAGMFSLSVSNTCGVASDVVLVHYDTDQPEISEPGALVLCEGDEIVLDVTQTFEADYLWDDGSALPVLVITSPGSYIVTVSSNCEKLIHEFEALQSDDCMKGYYIPNVFSPNGDQINDIFRIRGAPDTQIRYLRIFDRWGGLVYEKSLSVNGIADGWDGTSAGKPLDPGVFVFTALLVHRDGQEEIVSGSVTLVR